jgi:hypothetical protein
MSDVITTLLVQIKGDVTGVVADFKNFAAGVTGAEVKIKQMSQTADAASGHIHGLTYAVRSLFDQIRFGVGVGGPMALFYAFDEATRAMLANREKLQAMGISLTSLLGPGGVIAAAIAGSFVVWETYTKHLNDTTKAHKELMDELERIPGTVDKAFQAFKVGAISLDQLKAMEGYLSGATKLYKRDPYETDAYGRHIQTTEWDTMQTDDDGKKGSEQFLPLTTMGSYLSAGHTGQRPTLMNRTPATPGEIQADVERMLQDAYAKNAATVQQNETAGAVADNTNKFLKPVEDAAKKQNELLTQGLAIYKKQQEIIFGTAAKIGEMSAKAAQEDARHEEELRRQSQMQAQMQRDILRSAVEAQIESVKSNQLMPDQQKLQITSALNDKLTQINQAEIKDLENLKSQAASLTDQLELEKKIADLKQQNQKLADQTTPQQQNSFGFQFGKTITDQQNKWSGWAQESAKSFQNAWDGSTNAVSGGLTRLFEYGAQKGQWFREIWNGVIGSMISSVTKLAVDWIAQHVIMAGAEKILTAAAAEGSVERGAIRLAETIFHNMLVALRVAVHIAGEAAATAATYAYAIVRALYHAVVAAVAAMESEASVPYVGVILGIAAAAAIMAAAYGLMGGFAEGGYTGDGHPSKVAGVVHAGEYVIPANRVNSSTMPLLAAIHTGNYVRVTAPRSPDSSSSSSSGGSTVQHNTSHYIYTDKAKMARQIEQDDAHEQWVIDTVAKSSHKLK